MKTCILGFPLEEPNQGSSYDKQDELTYFLEK